MSVEAVIEATPDVGHCRHCGGEMPSGAEGFCCLGCRVVNRMLRERGLGQYYDIRYGRTSPAVLAPVGVDHKWLDAIEARIASVTGAQRVELDVQGLHCAACVWLQEQLFAQHAKDGGALDITVNPALGRVELLITPSFKLRKYVEDVEQFGYRLGPPIKRDEGRAGSLVGRIGVSTACALNAMLFSIPLELGLHEGPVFEVFRWLAFGLATLALYVGGGVFVRSAWQAARRGMLHLDVPIALGMILAWAGSTRSFLMHSARGAYFDTVTVFITLMLVGRWLQERVLDRNRAQVLASDGVDGLLARRVTDGCVEVVKCGALQQGDALLVAPGDLVPCAATLTDAAASCSLDWINGESAPREFHRDDIVPAGAFNVGSEALTLTATESFSDSSLPGLLRATTKPEGDSARTTRWWQVFTRVYVVLVLTLAVVGSYAWWRATGDVQRALDVATALLVVTCPCAFGLATPMAYEMTLAGLRRAGLFVRSASLLDRLPRVKQVVFDKTGTLTTGILELVDPTALDALDAAERAVLYNMVVRSTHPRSVAVRRAFEASTGARVFDGAIAVRETPGAGVEVTRGGETYRLGRRDWATGEGDARDLVFTRGATVRAALDTLERTRPDAAGEVAALRRAGYDVWILSGDETRRVEEMARTLGLAADHAVGDRTPEAKAAWLTAHDRRDTLMIGDGINDGLAVERAFCSATPSLDRPFMPARTDCYYLSAGLQPLRLALRAARALEGVHRRNLMLATGYNLVAVGLSLAGRMSPLLGSVLMPVSTLSVLAVTIHALHPGRSLWRS